MSRQGLSWKAKLKYAIDQVVKESDDFADFLLKCAQNGILVYYNPEHTIDLKFMLAEQKERNPRAKMTRAKTLGCKNGFVFRSSFITYINSETSARYYSYEGFDLPHCYYEYTRLFFYCADKDGF